MRCLRHAFRNTPSPDWWRRVLLVAPCHRVNAQGPTPGAVFTSEMISEATIDRIVELLKLTNAGNFYCFGYLFGLANLVMDYFILPNVSNFTYTSLLGQFYPYT